MKIHTILMFAAVASASVACAQGLTPVGKPRVQSGSKPAKELTPEEIERNRANAAALRKLIDDKGGWVSVPLSGPSLKLIDATARGWAMEGLETVKANLDRYALCPSEVVRKTVTGNALDDGRMAAQGACGVVMLIDSAEGAPIMTVHPEEHLAFLNMNAICKGSVSSGMRQDRIEKLTWRAIGHLVGCGAPDGYTCVMKPLRNISDLDSMPNKFIHPATFMKARGYFELLGVKPARKGTYESAAQQGWAPAPTNDIQKAIWDKVHAPPANPMKIEFDPKKGR